MLRCLQLCVSRSILFLFLISLLAVNLSAAVEESPTQKVHQAIDEIVKVLNDPQYSPPAKHSERESLIMKVADRNFDWEEMSRRSLARFWKDRTPEQKQEFVSLFRNLLEKTYIRKVESYSGEKVVYTGEKVEEDYAVVKTKIVSTSKNMEIPIEYRFHKKGDAWFVYDVSIEGVSLVNNYRTQFESILAGSTYDELVKRMKEKTAEKDLGKSNS